MIKLDLHSVADIMRETGRRCILPRWRNLQAGEISEKTGPLDLVTIADKESEAALTQALRALLPEALVLGEEAFAADPSIIEALRSDRPVWIIDPLDGTRPFAHGQENFGIIVALAQKDEVLAGWIHHPLTGDTLIAEKGGGAFWQGARCRVLPRAPLQEMKGALGVRLHLPVDKNPGEGLAPHFIRRSFVACEIYPNLLTGGKLFGLPDASPQYHFRATASYSRPWDDAAGALALREAGGILTDWEGKAYRPTMFDNGTIAANDAAAAEELRRWLLPAYEAARAAER